MVLDFGDRHNGIIFRSFPRFNLLKSFFNNTLQHPVIPTAGSKRPVSAELPELFAIHPPDYIIKLLQEQKVAQQILSIWFNRQADGSYNVDLLKQRGLYNANDNDFMAASASKRGQSTLMDMGLKLVNQSYVLVTTSLMSQQWRSTMIAKAIPTKERTSNGYKAK